MSRYFMDANVLINGCFCESRENNAVSRLAAAGATLLIDSWVEAEAVKTLRKLQAELALPFDPVEDLEAYTASARVIRLAATAPEAFEKVNRADRWVVAGARAANATLVTADGELVQQARAEGVPVRYVGEYFPEDYQVEAFPILGHRIKSGSPPNPWEGFFLIAIRTGNWLGVAQEFTLLDFRHSRAFYDGASGAWVFTQDGAPPLRVKMTAGTEQEWRIAVSWKAANAGALGQIGLYVAGPDGAACGKRSTSARNIKIGRDMRIGSTHTDQAYLNGIVQLIEISGRFLT